MFNFAWFKSDKEQEASWNANTLTMEQPSSPPAPVAQGQQGQIVTEQPEQMQIRGGHGNGGGICCGICAGLACFECCEICC